jgi:hypothetical protein
MRESESSVHYWAVSGSGDAQKVCSQLLANEPRYATWVSSHDRRMNTVARGRSREHQIVSLRLVATEQIHREALVRYMRDNDVKGHQRSIVLREFYGPLDAECAVLAAHREYQLAVSSHISATDLLALSADRYGAEMMEEYETSYGVYFAMHCDRARARAEGRPYLLASLLPEVRAGARNLRECLLSGKWLPSARSFRR